MGGTLAWDPPDTPLSAPPLVAWAHILPKGTCDYTNSQCSSPLVLLSLWPASPPVQCCICDTEQTTQHGAGASHTHMHAHTDTHACTHARTRTDTHSTIVNQCYNRSDNQPLLQHSDTLTQRRGLAAMAAILLASSPNIAQLLLYHSYGLEVR